MTIADGDTWIKTDQQPTGAEGQTLRGEMGEGVAQREGAPTVNA